MNASPARRRRGGDARDQQGQQHDEHNLVQLGWVPGNAVAEIDSPRQTRGNPARSIAQSRQKTADTTDRHADRERQNQEVARRDHDAESSLDELDGDQTANEATDNRFALEKEHRIVRR